MAEIFLDTLSYYKNESDEIADIERTRVDLALAGKSDKVSEGSPSGLATLNSVGTVNAEQIPMAGYPEAMDVHNTVSVMNPSKTHFAIEQRAVGLNMLGSASGVCPLNNYSKIDPAYITAAPQVNTYVVLTITERNAIIGVLKSDRCVVTSEVDSDLNGEYVASVDSPSGIEWYLLPNLSTVASVNGQTGAVVINSVGESAQNKIDISSLTALALQNRDDVTQLETATAVLPAYDLRITNNSASITMHTANIFALGAEQNTQSGRLDTLEAERTYVHTYDYNKTTDHIVTNDIYEEVGRLTTLVRETGVYELKLSLTYNLNSISNSAFLRFSIDGGLTWNEFEEEPKDKANKIPVYYAFADEHTEGIYDIIVEARKESVDDVLHIYFLDIIAERKG